MTEKERETSMDKSNDNSRTPYSRIFIVAALRLCRRALAICGYYVLSIYILLFFFPLICLHVCVWRAPAYRMFIHMALRLRDVPARLDVSFRIIHALCACDCSRKRERFTRRERTCLVMPIRKQTSRGTQRED